MTAMQNIYDNPQFYEGYERLRMRGEGLNEALEQPALRSLLPPLQDASVLDIGCGFGDFCRFAQGSGASRVVGIDPSQRMLSTAKNQAKQEHYETGSFENLCFDERFDLVVSSLSLHYVKELSQAFRNVAAILKKPNGLFIFSMEHPIATCGLGRNGGWVRDAQGRKVAWKVESYADEGVRESRWFVDGVIKYHRTVATIVNELVNAGFSVDRMLEPYAIPEAEEGRPELLEERERPPFLLIRASLQNKDMAVE